MDLNRVMMLGHLATEVGISSTPGGSVVGRFTVALNRRYKNPTTGAFIKKVTWVRVTVWGHRATACKKYLDKGALVFLEGFLENSSWIDDRGSKHNALYVNATNVRFLSRKDEA